MPTVTHMGYDMMAKGYKLVILGPDWDLYKLAFGDLTPDRKNYIGGIMPSGIWHKWWFKLHLTPKINSIVSLPGKGIWNKFFMKTISKNHPIVFLVFPIWLSLDAHTNLFEYLKTRYPGCKIVLFLTDILASMKDFFTWKPVDLKKHRNNLDLIISYDHDDARKYGLECHNTVLSNIPAPKSDKPSCDILFIGKDKGRLPMLAKVYTHMKSAGLKCIFILLDVRSEDRIMEEEIVYVDKPLTYMEILGYVANCRCLLEIIQPGAIGITYRTLESIAYSKILLTNNRTLKSSELYDSESMFLFDRADDITPGIIQKIKNLKIKDSPEKKKLKDIISPFHLIKFIETKLNLTIDI